MGINKKHLAIYEEAYKDLPAIIRPIEFLPGSEYYHIEEWKMMISKYIPGLCDNMYMISSHGRIYNIITNSFVNQCVGNHKYIIVSLKKQDGGYRGITVSRAVLLHFCFVPNCHYLEVDHIDGNKENNCLWNLEWVTPQENTHRAILKGLRPLSCTVNTGILLTDEQAYELYVKGSSGKYSLSELAKEYNVKEQYVFDLVHGTIRPYIAQRFNYSSNHYIAK